MATAVRMINTKAHALLDYALGLTLIASPLFFDYPAGGTPHIVAAIAGLLTILYAAITGFEYSIIKKLEIRPHLWLDGVNGALLAISPWALGFCPVVYKPHLVFGLTLVIVALLTDRMLYESVKGIGTGNK